MSRMSNDAISSLNNYLQGKGRDNLDGLSSLTWVDSTSGPKDLPVWTSVCKINGVERGRGTGTRKHIARNQAAAVALNYLQAETPPAN
ncbi:hypothetical protein BDZ94DRAFT_22911 [Collybia nuda]|uniref:DRBM domain-containing protein n=1 Tax=Collybia nuda TaxID=64659 RepID=A0A9P5YJH1_9AGAR|nr:hypothetical protein BDZ94DRAFT_22911 [Collybia nuda]